MNPPETPPPPPLRVLLLAAAPTLVDGLPGACRSLGVETSAESVATAPAFLDACRSGAFDCGVLAVGREEVGPRLAEIRELAPGVPVVVAAAEADPAFAMRCLGGGAEDCVDGLDPAAVARAVVAARLRRRESLFRQVTEHARDLVCLHSTDWVIRHVSPSIRRLLGHAPAEWLGRQPRELVHPDDVAQLLAEAGALDSYAGGARPVTARYRHKEGHYVWFELELVPIRDAAGRPTRWMSVSRDDTARRRTGIAAGRGERLFGGIAEANRLLLTTGRVVEALPEVLRSLGEASGADRILVLETRRDGGAGPRCALRLEWSRPPAHAGSGVAELAVPDDRAETVRRALEGRGLGEMLTFAIPVRDGAWGHLCFGPRADRQAWSSGETSALGMVALNIGQAVERELAVTALGESQLRYEALLAGLSEGIFQIDREARWRFLNPTWEQLTGYRVSESIGKKFSSFLAGEEAAAALEIFGRLVSGADESIESEVRFKHRLGGEIWLRVTAQRQIDDQGRMLGVSGTLMDVTQRRLAQEALRASERKFAAVFAGASDALLLFDNNTNLIVECNPRAVEMFECDGAAELIGTSGASLQKAPIAPAKVAQGRMRLARGEVWSDEQHYLTRRGRAFWGLFAVVRMTPETLGTTLVRITDISNIKQSEEQLRASLAEKEVLLKEVYHRVKNNLQIISALLRMQSRRVNDRVAMEALENSISRVMAMSMVHEKLYRAQNLASIDFLSFVEGLVGFLNQLTIGGQSGIEVEVDGEPLTLSIDQAIPLGLILNELVTNALKYAFPEGRAGRVRIHVGAAAGGRARVTVEDDGVGMDPDVDPENADGLGFRIVNMLVEQLDARLALETTGGLRAVIEVPLAPAGAKPPDPVATTANR